MKYEALLFDVGSTLLELTKPKHLAWAEALAGLGGPSAEALSEAFKEALDERQVSLKTPESLEDHRAEWSEIYRQALKHAGHRGEAEAAIKIMWDVWLYRAWRPYPEVRSVLETLRKGGCKLAIVSNWPPTLNLTLDRLGLTPYFDAVVCSSLVGYAKPDKAIFDFAIERIGVSRDRALHVGDSYEADVLGAQGAGVDAALLLRTTDVPANNYSPILRSLDEVIGLQL